jgi:3-deoxy-manno-octulosonate cytidylyltransferase (CMP-KDO synthetase)
MKAIGIIPARFASTRFPGKPLAEIGGKTMIRRVYEQASSCPGLMAVFVATDHQAIAEHVMGFGGIPVITSALHHSGTERCAEALQLLLNEKTISAPDVVVNIQGDEPFIQPDAISELIECFTSPEVKIATLVRRIMIEEEIADPNVVKVVLNHAGLVSYFSRAAVPFCRSHGTGIQPVYFKHIGIYAFLGDILPELVRLPVAPAEIAEALEQLRWLYHGYPVTAKVTEYESISVDTPADLLKITNK